MPKAEEGLRSRRAALLTGGLRGISRTARIATGREGEDRRRRRRRLNEIWEPEDQVGDRRLELLYGAFCGGGDRRPAGPAPFRRDT